MSNDRRRPLCHPVLRAADVHRRVYAESDRELFARQLRDFVPPNAFDAHAHLYDLRHLVPDAVSGDFAGAPGINHSVLIDSMRQWMADRVATDGLYFPFPIAGLDCLAANRFLANALQERPGSRGLMLIRPADDPADTEARLREHDFAGFKVYHVFAEREETFLAEQGEFLPEWAWELANCHSLLIMMHMVLPRALSDPRNQDYIREHCHAYPHAKLVLAHAARGFNANHTVEAIHSLRGLTNIWFDTSAVCEPSGMEAILETFGTTRLMYGSDFPVSEMRGRCVSVGDGFHWLHDDNVMWDDGTTIQLLGIESLLAVRQACRTLKLLERDLEHIFGGNARQLLGIEPSTSASASATATQPSVTKCPPDVQTLYRHAKTLIPGGTQLLSKRPEMFAPEIWPAYYEQAIGCEVVDTDGRRYTDMSHCGILSCILGFADPDVNAAVLRRVHLGSMATQQTAEEVELAQLLTEIHPWAQQARFTRSGGEAMAVAVRIARASTRRSHVVVCGYHGWHDWYLAANIRVPPNDPTAYPLDSHLLPGLEPLGVPAELAGTVSTFSYNRLDQLDVVLDRCDGLAAIVMEPTRGTDPVEGFLEGVRDRAHRRKALLIFDEISSAWRLCLGGAHRLFGVDPDLAVFAKGMSNGFAMGAVIGRGEAMQACHNSFISSTYWTEGIGPAAAVATIKKMKRICVPAHLKRLGSRVMSGWQSLGNKHGLALTITGRPASCSLDFDHPNNDAILTLMTTLMLERGFLASGTCSLTLAHDDHCVDCYLDALDQVFGELAEAIAAQDVTDRLSGPVKRAGFGRLAE